MPEVVTTEPAVFKTRKVTALTCANMRAAQSSGHVLDMIKLSGHCRARPEGAESVLRNLIPRAPGWPACAGRVCPLAGQPSRCALGQGDGALGLDECLRGDGLC
jgi:hypothetical protein